MRAIKNASIAIATSPSWRDTPSERETESGSKLICVSLRLEQEASFHSTTSKLRSLIKNPTVRESAGPKRMGGSSLSKMRENSEE